MSLYRLTISRRADHDADAIFDWVAQRSTVGASSWFSAFRDTLREIVESPHSYARAPEADLLDRDIRQPLFKTRRGQFYRALFIIRDDAVHVVAVRGYGQNLATPDDLELPT